MGGVSLECILIVGYAVALAFISLALERMGHHAHRRSLRVHTAGFTYHPEHDLWRCPRDQHLFPIFSDAARGVTIYRAPADACNSCRSKAACTDSNIGREIESKDLSAVESGMRTFHRAVSLTLLVLATVLIVCELFRVDDAHARVVLGFVGTLFLAIIGAYVRTSAQKHFAV